MRYSEHIPRPQGTPQTTQLAGSEEEKRTVRKIVKKKKPRKYKVRNQFRYAKSKQSGYHPHYIFDTLIFFFGCVVIPREMYLSSVSPKI